jgi:S-formylglutathione hydrolase FrmB
VRRRAFIIGGVAATAAVAAGGIGLATEMLPGSVAVRRRIGWTGPDGVVPDVPAGLITRRRVTSKARGTTTNVVTIAPYGVSEAAARKLPVCVMLHGRGSSANGFVALGMPQFLTKAVRDGVAPFVLAAVDGGQASYWYGAPQRMLQEELPGWVGAEPRAVLGISMGGFGALLYARERAGLDAVALLSPALFRSWADARAVGPFANEGEWAANEPLRHIAQLQVPGRDIGLWCGREDPFQDSARALAARVLPATESFGHGAHDMGYWRRVAPDALRFVGARVAANA